jgi:hypothetical protein
MKFSLVFLSLACVMSTVGCSSRQSDSEKSAGPNASATASAPAPKSAAASASAANGVPGSSADANGALTFVWKVTNAQSPRVSVSAVVGDQTISLGSLDATEDGPANGTADACSMKNAGNTSSTLHCGGVPAYNHLNANITGGALVITLTQGTEGVPGSEKVTEVARRPTSATSLHATGPASPLLSGNCRRGYVQRTAESPCLRQCLKGTECKSPDVCTMIGVTGGDGPHKVHACVPPGK